MLPLTPNSFFLSGPLSMPSFAQKAESLEIKAGGTAFGLWSSFPCRFFIVYFLFWGLLMALCSLGQLFLTRLGALDPYDEGFWLAFSPCQNVAAHEWVFLCPCLFWFFGFGAGWLFGCGCFWFGFCFDSLCSFVQLPLLSAHLALPQLQTWARRAQIAAQWGKKKFSLALSSRLRSLTSNPIPRFVLRISSQFLDYTKWVIWRNIFPVRLEGII